MSASNRLIVAILIVAALAIGFWMLLLGPKREEADKLSGEVETLKVTLAQADSVVATAEAAKREFPANYRQLVALGEAVPEGDETASLLVELNRVAANSKVRFENFQLSSSGETVVPEAAAAVPPPEAPATGAPGSVPAAATVPPTEAAASLMPLGASIGPAGLAVMPYNLTFSGSFFQIADFIQEIDSLVETKTSKVGVEGRLVTIDGFSLTSSGSEEQSEDGRLNASFVVTTYLTPPGQGVTAGATPIEPAPSTSVPTSSEESTETAETATAR
jgi:Tfp pilus assembly protein PilO